jgi:hypothetical protein
MRRTGILLGLAAVVAATATVGSAPANADNRPTFRDCSAFVAGLDPDFVQLLGATVTPQGTLTVSPSQNRVQVEASESSDPGDNLGHVTLTVTVTGPHSAPVITSGAAVDKVVLAVPLAGSGTGKTYTIDWTATFDNGNHACPSPTTPANTSANPFVVAVR